MKAFQFKLCRHTMKYTFLSAVDFFIGVHGADNLVMGIWEIMTSVNFRNLQILHSFNKVQ